uniref:G-protein coupled receptors family 1 profile domain-containing protein n=1 Tax=Meloidogyne javanica TaxID=6303 RepID=A0A915LIK7_MELJA
MDKLTTAKQLLFNNQTNNYLNKQEDILVVDYGVEDDDSYLNELTDEEYIDFVADFLKPTPIEWVFVVLFFILMVVGICGNCLVVYVVSRNKHMWTSMNLFLTNLALSDLLVLVFCLPPTVLNDITKTFWLSEGFCKAMLFVQWGTRCKESWSPKKFRKEFRRACCCGEQRKESLNRKESMMAFRRPSSFSPANAQRHHIPLSRRCTALSQSSAAQML